MINKKMVFIIITGLLILSVLPIQAQEKLAPRPELEHVFEYEVNRDDPNFDGSRMLPPPPPAAWVKLSDEDEMKIIEFSKTIDPQISADLEDLKAKSPNRYERKIQRLYREYVFLKRLEEEEPQRYKEAIDLRRQSARAEQLAGKYKKSGNEAERAQVLTELKQILNNVFDLREKERFAEIDRIRTRLERLQKEMKERRENKSEIVENHLNKIIGKDHLYEW